MPPRPRSSWGTPDRSPWAGRWPVWTEALIAVEEPRARARIETYRERLTGKRVFRMAPLQHHFELKGWQEVTIVIRFWIIAGLFVAFGLGLFYAEWVVGAL